MESRLARSEMLLPAIGGSDEIAHLDRVFHDMATALAEAARKERAVVQHAIDTLQPTADIRRIEIRAALESDPRLMSSWRFPTDFDRRF